MGLEMIEAGWMSILPPLIAIILALITKEVYSSLFLGAFSGMCIYCFLTGGNLLQAVTFVFDMMAAKIGENGYMMGGGQVSGSEKRSAPGSLPPCSGF